MILKDISYLLLMRAKSMWYMKKSETKIAFTKVPLKCALQMRPKNARLKYALKKRVQNARLQRCL